MTKSYSDRVARHFEKEWAEYDQEIRVAIPHYDQALATLVSVAGKSMPTPKRILDLGIGTGALAERLLVEFPGARLDGIDLVEDFLKIARERLSGFQTRLSLHCADLADMRVSGSFDLVVTSFAFHHLTDAVKQRLNSEIFAALSPGGCFLNADFVDSGSSFFSRVFDELRIELLRKYGWSDEEIQRRYIEHRSLEVPAPMEVQIAWLRESGFTDVECVWKYLNLAIFGGRKPETIGTSTAEQILG